MARKLIRQFLTVFPILMIFVFVSLRMVYAQKTGSASPKNTTQSVDLIPPGTATVFTIKNSLIKKSLKIPARFIRHSAYVHVKDITTIPMFDGYELIVVDNPIAAVLQRKKMSPGKYLLHCYPDVLWVMVESLEGTTMTQMSLPSINVYGATYIPFREFLLTLEQAGMYTIKGDETVAYITPRLPRFSASSYSHKNTSQEKESRQTPLLDKNKTEMFDDQQTKTQKSIPPSKYQIPPDLIRPNLSPQKKREQGSLHIDSLYSPDFRIIAVSDKITSLESFPILQQPQNSIKYCSTTVSKNSTQIHFITNVYRAPKPRITKRGNTVTILWTNSRINSTNRLLDTLSALNVSNIRAINHTNDCSVQFTLSSSKRVVRLLSYNEKKAVIEIRQIESSKRIQTDESENASVVSNRKARYSHKEWKLDCIVIDPGHGGKDNGATGLTGVYEKSIVLRVAKKLKMQLKKRMPDVRVILTRNDDSFVELWKRGEIANRNKGKLFLSLHCNSMPSKPNPIHGIETYILSAAKSDMAVEISRRENNVISLESENTRYKGLTDDQLILATLAQNSFIKLSTQLARLIQSNVAKSSGMANRGVHQAGFIVLIGASMPSVLVELGFLSNADDNAALTTSKRQNKIVSGLASALELYSRQYKSLLKKQK